VDLVEKAITIAASAHSGQHDKGGGLYVLHPMRVMLSVHRAVGNDESLLCVAMLHDVIEDTRIDMASLAASGFPRGTLDALDAISRRKGEAHHDYLRRVNTNDTARLVKIHDIIDNMNLTRIPDPSEADRDRVGRYAQDLAYLRNGIG